MYVYKRLKLFLKKGSPVLILKCNLLTSTCLAHIPEIGSLARQLDDHQ